MKKYFSIDGLLVPAISGASVESIGSTLSVSFDGSYSFNTNTTKSSDILFTQLAIGEGPIYRINPNGPQDIEIDNKYIDDLVDFNTNNTKPSIFAASYSTGTLSQASMPSFSTEQVTNIRFTGPIVLKSGFSSNPEISAPASSSVLFFPTSSNPDEVAPIDCIKIKFTVTSLKTVSVSGDEPAQLSLAALVHPATEISNINNYLAGGGTIINSLVLGDMSAELEIKIPAQYRSAQGYRVSIIKISDDVAEDGYESEVEVAGFDEIRTIPFSYPRTAIAGYAVKSTDFRKDSIPSFSSLVKGMIVDVPSNYNQPILESGEVDWRQLEVPESGSDSYQIRGYRLQATGTNLLFDLNPEIYSGIWDGSYKRDWTQNPVWIIKYILTDILGIPETSIDRYNFYSTAQYCDAVDSKTGRFTGVKGVADGSFRYKPNRYLTSTIYALLGLPQGTIVRERRFISDLSVMDESAALDVLTAIASSFFGIISVSSGKIRLVVDTPDSIPVAMFNETNMQQGSFTISGIRQEDIVNSVDASYINFSNHFTKETVNVRKDQSALVEQENKVSIDIAGCTRKSQALRMANYLLNSGYYIKRKIQFTAFADASDLEIGDLISVSHMITGASFGYGGQILSDSTTSDSNVYLEHFTAPGISESVFTSNSNPIVLKVFNQVSNELNYYITSNTDYSLTSSSNSSSGYDQIRVKVLSQLNKSTKTFNSFSSFASSKLPRHQDLWALGEINPASLTSSTADKLFKVDELTQGVDGSVSITATEHIPNILADLDESSLNMSGYSSYSLNYTTPPVPVLTAGLVPSQTPGGAIRYDLVMSPSINSSGYNIPVSTVINYSPITSVIEITSQV